MDRFASIRIPGSKKERPPLSNLRTAFSNNDCSSEMNENIPKPLSEKEILELFEKMMVRILIHCKMFDVKALALAYVHGTKCV